MSPFWADVIVTLSSSLKQVFETPLSLLFHYVKMIIGPLTLKQPSIDKLASLASYYAESYVWIKAFVCDHLSIKILFHYDQAKT